MKFLLIVFVMWGSLAHAQLSSVQKSSKEFEAQNASQAKTVMLYESTLKAMQQFAPELGVQFADFQAQLNKKFESYFEDLKEQKLVAAYGKNYKTTLDKESQEKFLAGLNEKRDDEFRKFSRVGELVQSYSFKTIEQSNQNPKIWNAEVQLTLDKVKLDRLFRRIISEEKKQFDKIFILGELDISRFEWKDLGLEKESSFTGVLNDTWDRWFNENLSPNVGEVQICGIECRDFIRDWEQTPIEKVEGKLDPYYKDSVLVHVSMDVKRTSFHESLKESSFEWEGRVVLLDINTKRVLASYVLPLEKRDLRNMDLKAQNSALASSLYRTPLSAFLQLKKKLTDAQKLNRVSRLVIQGHRHLGDVVALMELLKTRGSLLGLDLKLDYFKSNEAELLCFYQGEEKSFSDLLSRVKELKSSQSYVLVNEFTGINHVIKLVTE